MCRFAVQEFPSAAESVSRARHWVATTLTQWAISGSDIAELLTTELMSNAVRHGRGEPTVSVAVERGAVEVGVRDFSDVPPRLQDRLSDPTAQSGRGMHIVDTLAADWGVTPLELGKCVWFRMESGEWAYNPTCRCRGDESAVSLPSGHSVVHLSGPWDG